ncbi:hypothetical protein MP228_009648 [Amoeboaphelidium protococcarum]|nr:hypothetical protein MP228_009648 [Amoeboaphelidium protococcarum]
MLKSTYFYALLSLIFASHVISTDNIIHPEVFKLTENADNDFIQVELGFESRLYELHLKPANEVVHTDAQVYIHYQEDGANVEQYGISEYELYPYSGKVVENNLTVGWVRISFNDDDDTFNGVLSIRGLSDQVQESFQILTVKQYQKHVAIHKLPKLQQKLRQSVDVILIREDKQHGAHGDLHTACGVDLNDPVHSSLHQQILSRIGDQRVVRRQSGKCLSSPMTMVVDIVADCSYFSLFSNTQDVLQQILSNVNQASQLYQDTFNIILAIGSVNIQTTCNADEGQYWNTPCREDYPMITRLSDFSKWRGDQKSTSGLFILMTKCSFGQTVGVAWLGSACQTTVSVQQKTGSNLYLSGTAVVSSSWFEWATLAHEIAHTFSSVHDCSAGCGGCVSLDACKQCFNGYSNCPCCSCGSGGQCDCQAKYLMSPTSAGTSNTFSPCTINMICAAKDSWSKCLKAPNTQRSLTANMCGNGVLESGEECDVGRPGSQTASQSTCCDASTCKLKPGAQCDPFNQKCCTSQCRPKKAGEVCRKAIGVCDIDDQCNGISADCPQDARQPDLSQCYISSKNMTGQCARGYCTSRNYQCLMKQLNGVVGECPGHSNQCSMFCRATGAVGSCIEVQGSFFDDGTACGLSGVCERGKCVQSGWSAFIGFINDHSGFFIIIFVFCGTLLLGVAYKHLRRYQKIQGLGLAGFSINSSLSRPKMVSSYSQQNLLQLQDDSVEGDDQSTIFDRDEGLGDQMTQQQQQPSSGSNKSSIKSQLKKKMSKKADGKNLTLNTQYNAPVAEKGLSSARISAYSPLSPSVATFSMRKNQSSSKAGTSSDTKSNKTEEK